MPGTAATRARNDSGGGLLPVPARVSRWQPTDPSFSAQANPAATTNSTALGWTSPPGSPATWAEPRAGWKRLRVGLAPTSCKPANIAGWCSPMCHFRANDISLLGLCAILLWAVATPAPLGVCHMASEDDDSACRSRSVRP